MASLNRTMLIGRLTADPDAPRNLSNAEVVSFRFAVGRSKKNPQTGQWENDPNPLYIDCEVWHQQGQKRDLCNLVTNYARKGSQLYIEGRLKFEQWDDKNGGGKRSKHKLIVESLELLDRAQEGGGGGREDSRHPHERGRERTPAPASTQTGYRQPVHDGDVEGDIPF